MENKTEIMQHILQMQQISFLPEYIKLNSRSRLLHDFVRFTYANTGHLEVKFHSIIHTQFYTNPQQTGDTLQGTWAH